MISLSALPLSTAGAVAAAAVADALRGRQGDGVRCRHRRLQQVGGGARGTQGPAVRVGQVPRRWLRAPHERHVRLNAEPGELVTPTVRDMLRPYYKRDDSAATTPRGADGCCGVVSRRELEPE
eukprot:540223-Prymnesium_polylepis.1